MKRNLCFACCGLILGITVTQVDLLTGALAQGTDGQKKCDYTYVRDNVAPGIGRDGDIKYSDEWKKVIESGWVLKIASAPGAGYIFEKCR